MGELIFYFHARPNIRKENAMDMKKRKAVMELSNLITTRFTNEFKDISERLINRDENIFKNPSIWNDETFHKYRPTSWEYLPLLVITSYFYYAERHSLAVARQVIFAINLENIINGNSTIETLFDKISNDFETWSEIVKHHDPIHKKFEAMVSHLFRKLLRHSYRGNYTKIEEVVFEEMSNKLMYSTVDFLNTINKISHMPDDNIVSELSDYIGTLIINFANKSRQDVKKHKVINFSKSINRKLKFVIKHNRGWFDILETKIISNCLSKAKDIDRIASLLKPETRVLCSFNKSQVNIIDSENIADISKLTAMFYDKDDIEKIKYTIEKEIMHGN